MELWIRSQDKAILIKVDNISYINISKDNEKEIHSLCSDFKNVLGTYKTKRRALEVLDEIEDLMRSLCDSNFKIIRYEMPKK